MAKKFKDRISAFAGIETEGADEARHRLTSGHDEPDDATPDAAQEPEPVERNKGGRPRNEVQRQKTVLYLNPANVVAMKTRAVEGGTRFSDVVDALIQYHLDDLTDDELLSIKNPNRTKDS